MRPERLRDKFLGALVGTALGDALGAGFEGGPGVEEEEILGAAEARPRLVYTDDTHMSLGVAQSLAEKEGLDGEHMAQTFIRNYRQEPWRGYGPGPPQVFRSISAGVPWDRASSQLYGSGSYGNGSAMRAAPIGLFYYDDPEMLRWAACRSSQITHAHELAKEGAALQAYAVALALREPGPLEPHSFLESLSRFARTDLYRSKLEAIASLLEEQPSRAEAARRLGNSIEAFNSVPAAIYSFLSHPQAFEPAALYAVSLGGDTDTIAAMAGGIAGAYHGLERLPQRWWEKLENREHIQRLAQRLWEVRQSLASGRGR